MAATGEQHVVQMLSCPLTLQFFHDPVMTSTGHIYEFAALLETYLSTKGDVLIDPITRQTCTRFLTIPWALRSLMQKLCPEKELANRVAGEMIDMNKKFKNGFLCCRYLEKGVGSSAPVAQGGVVLAQPYNVSIGLQRLGEEVQEELRRQEEISFEAESMERKRRRLVESDTFRFVEEVREKRMGIMLRVGDKVCVYVVVKNFELKILLDEKILLE